MENKNNIVSDKKRIIIFGAGRFGGQCLGVYGDRVVAFVDNNADKQGTDYMGKSVWSFDQYKEYFRNYHTIVATNYYSEISEQIRAIGNDDYSFFIPGYSEAVSRIAEKIKTAKGRVIILGIEADTEIVIKNLEYNGIDVDRIIFADKHYSDNIGKIYFDKTVCSILDVYRECDSVFAGSYRCAYALKAYTERECPDMKFFNPFIRNAYFSTDDLVINRYEGIGDKDETAYIEERETDAVRESVRDYAKELYKRLPLFEFIEIETVNWCNGLCEFCPVSVPNNKREKIKIESDLLYNIIDQLSLMDYKGRLALFSNGEPFLDDRIIEFHKYAREKCPKARLHLFTNGTLLSLDKFKGIIEYLDELIIDNYDQELKLIPNSKTIMEFCQDKPQLRKKVSIVLRKPKEILTSRGGDAPNRTRMEYFPDDSCVLPFKQMTVRADGKVSLCCNDVMGQLTLGDTKNESLTDIWYGEKFERIREQLLIGRKEVNICKYCDAFSLF